jgi:hypothetical protein
MWYSESAEKIGYNNVCFIKKEFPTKFDPWGTTGMKLLEGEYRSNFVGNFFFIKYTLLYPIFSADSEYHMRFPAKWLYDGKNL